MGSSAAVSDELETGFCSFDESASKLSRVIGKNLQLILDQEDQQ